MDKTILLLGDTGMLGQSIRKEFEKQGYLVIGASRSSKDYAINLLYDNRIKKIFSEVKPDIVINSAAIVSIDVCEENLSDAYLINGRFPGIVAENCKESGAYFVQISTDHFFSGDGEKKHSESDKVMLVNEYARTKYIGEQLSLIYDNSLVVRTNVVGFRGKGPDTFIEWVIRCMEIQEAMSLYYDFYTSSINSKDFARILADVIHTKKTGVLNISSSEVVNKKDFILELVKEIYGYIPQYKEESIHSVSKTKRADSIGLDTSYVEEIVGYRMPGFKETICSIADDYRRRKKNEI